MSYLGNTPTTQSFISGTDYFNGDGSTTAFTLSRTVASVNDIEAVVNNVVQQPNSAYTLSGTTITFTSAPSAGTNNIYVRYLSTTTQSITPAQNTVSYSTMNTDMQSLFGQSFTNRIINGAMMIDQRNAGASVAFTSAAYTLDRWVGAAGTATGSTIQRSTTAPSGFSNSALVTIGTGASPSSGAVNRLYQVIEGYNIADLGWGTADAQTVTLSFKVRSSVTGTFSGALYGASTIQSYPFSYIISVANTWTTVSVTIAGPTTGTWDSTNGAGIYVNFDLGSGTTFKTTAGAWTTGTYIGVTGATNLVATTGATFYITGVQLEKGSTATSFDYRPYSLEKYLCYRYFQYLLIAQGNSQVGVIRASSSGATASEFNMPFTFSPMRTGPTATYVSGSQTSFTAYSLAGSSSTWTISQITSTFDTSINELQYDGVRIRGGNTGYSDGQPYFGVANSGWIACTLSAEL